jgi:hypothetical protein
MSANDRVRLGMVGGGQGAFIGAVHRMAARLDDAYQLVCGGCHPMQRAHINPPLKSAWIRIAATAPMTKCSSTSASDPTEWKQSRS